MNLSELARRALPTPEPIFLGRWGLISLRPELGSQQEFIVGAAAEIEGDSALHVRWVASLMKLARLYGEDTSTADLQTLVDGCARALDRSTKNGFVNLDFGSPHVRLVQCGYFAADNIEAELTQLLRRHANAIWPEPGHREERMGDDWAYAEMLKAVDGMRIPDSVIIPGRKKIIGNRAVDVAFDNRRSYGAVVSARYSQYSTIERHILRAQMNLAAAHKLDGRDGAKPALFVMFPYSSSRPEDVDILEKSSQLLLEVEDSGVQSFPGSEPADLARALEAWAAE